MPPRARGLRPAAVAPAPRRLPACRAKRPRSSAAPLRVARPSLVQYVPALVPSRHGGLRRRHARSPRPTAGGGQPARQRPSRLASGVARQTRPMPLALRQAERARTRDSAAPDRGVDLARPVPPCKPRRLRRLPQTPHALACAAFSFSDSTFATAARQTIMQSLIKVAPSLSQRHLPQVLGRLLYRIRQLRRRRERSWVLDAAAQALEPGVQVRAHRIRRAATDVLAHPFDRRARAGKQ
jgi:hypothetical protein